MSGIFYFTQFQLDVLHTRLSSKQPVTKEEVGAIANLLEVEKNKVYQWFRNKPQLKTPQVDLGTRFRNAVLLSEASNKAYNGVDYHGARNMKGRRLKRLQDIYFKSIAEWERKLNPKCADHTLNSSDSASNSEDWFSRIGIPQLAPMFTRLPETKTEEFFSHFERIVVRFREIPLEDLVVLKEAFITTTHMKYFALEGHNMDEIKLEKAFGAPFYDDYTEQKTWFFKIRGSEEHVLKVKFVADKLIFRRKKVNKISKKCGFPLLRF